MATNVLNMKLATISFALLAGLRCCMADKYVLFMADTLREGQHLKNHEYKFSLQKKRCNLALYDEDEALWVSNAPPVGSESMNCYAKLQSDGQFVLRDKSNTVIWSSNTKQDHGEGNYVLILQPDHNVVIYGGIIWATKTSVATSTSTSSTSILWQNSTAAGGGGDEVMVN